MTNERDVRSLPWLEFSYRLGEPLDFAISTFLGSWDGEYKGAWVIGSQQDIKLLSEFDPEREFTLREPMSFPREDLGSYLHAAFRVSPKGFLVCPAKDAVHGVRLLRFTQVSQLGSREVSYRLSSPSGLSTSFDTNRPLQELVRLATFGSTEE